jgi:hypothetical protein
MPEQPAWALQQHRRSKAAAAAAGCSGGTKSALACPQQPSGLVISWAAAFPAVARLLCPRLGSGWLSFDGDSPKHMACADVLPSVLASVTSGWATFGPTTGHRQVFVVLVCAGMFVATCLDLLLGTVLLLHDGWISIWLQGDRSRRDDSCREDLNLLMWQRKMCGWCLTRRKSAR